MLPVKILLLEDNETDVALIKRIVLKQFPEAQFTLVKELADFEFAIKNRVADMVIADYNLITFNALDLLKIIADQNSSIPCIVVSGVISDQETISELFKQGAKDVVLKRNLNHLNERLNTTFKKLREMYLKRPEIFEAQHRVRKQLAILEERIEKLILLENSKSKDLNLLSSIDFKELEHMVCKYYENQLTI
ncbi:response regulator [Aquimarina sp. ERC-38]|uniref:response regulator n=1 Tax=Aquimarina sp. ERC-38 TaxID=2949996 RepID=UPI0022481B46|nr:response regulator [Aquimarina sp. ERC-38]UZO79300.1 response regulator [Aquimarina sp. ERC-38]